MNRAANHAHASVATGATIRKIILEHFQDTVALLACEVGIEVLLYGVGNIPAVRPDFVEGCHTVIKWIAFATLGYLGVDSIVQMIVLRWRDLIIPGDPRPATSTDERGRQ